MCWFLGAIVLGEWGAYITNNIHLESCAGIMDVESLACCSAGERHLLLLMMM
jgi:hypothetical protein